VEETQQTVQTVDVVVVQVCLTDLLLVEVGQRIKVLMERMVETLLPEEEVELEQTHQLQQVELL
tara:strand:+ start:402 stop:593 length:192 start_codon:yes stop_codon:yes gene_type:complete